MSLALVDYGCHSFSYRLASTLFESGLPIKYIANGSLESPNRSSLAGWSEEYPEMVENISCSRPYGKIGLRRRFSGELEWGRRCVRALREMKPEAIVVNCVPLTAVTPIHRWAMSERIPFVYWLQDIQSRAMYDLLGRKMGPVGRTVGALAYIWEQEILERSDLVITIAPGHEHELPAKVRRTGAHELLANWANIEEFPQYGVVNEWSRKHDLHKTLNVMYSGTLGMKHDLDCFIALAKRFEVREDVRVVIVSSDQAALKVRDRARGMGLKNLVVLPFQPYSEVPKVLASASVLIAPLDASAGGFCVPSKILSYLCAGRPIVVAISDTNAAALTVKQAAAGFVVAPGHPQAFIERVETLLENETLRAAAGRSARAYAEMTFGIDKISARFMDIVQRANPKIRLPELARTAVAR